MVVQPLGMKLTTASCTLHTHGQSQTYRGEKLVNTCQSEYFSENFCDWMHVLSFWVDIVTILLLWTSLRLQTEVQYIKWIILLGLNERQKQQAPPQQITAQHTLISRKTLVLISSKSKPHITQMNVFLCLCYGWNAVYAKGCTLFPVTQQIQKQTDVIFQPI